MSVKTQHQSGSPHHRGSVQRPPGGWLWLLCALLLMACSKASSGTHTECPSGVQCASAQPPKADDRPPAPELEGGDAWLNTDQPLKLADLRGHVVVLDFWTYCCINCMHVLPELERLEHRFAGKPVVVIGVHSGKFDAEKDAARIRDAMGRHGVAHPVVVDSDFRIWNRFGVNAWPTLVVIDTDGKVAAVRAGEPEPGTLGDLVEVMLARAEANGTLAKQPIAIRKPPAKDTGPLSYPGKVTISPAGTVAIADSNHHRIVLVDLDGNLMDVAGSGIAGSADGSFEEAAFRRPQGMAFSDDGSSLYVADTENHQIRRLDLSSRRVTTIAGTGKKGDRRRGGEATKTALRSPWALALKDDALLVAMAGSHQIWRHDLKAGTIAPFAGSGVESIDDGPLAKASFSQPSGLALIDDTLYVADSEVSAVRAIDLKGKRVRTLVGTGLFDFGDRDGSGKEARLQHALGVVLRGEALFVADTFNNKIKRLDPASGEVQSVAGGARQQLYEPGGLTLLPDGRLLIADTNNHRLRTLDPESGALIDFALKGVSAPATRGLVMTGEPRHQSAAEGGAAAERIKAKGALGPGQATLLIDLAPPAGAKLTDGAPVSVRATSSGQGIEVPTPKVRTTLGPGKLPLRLPLQLSAGAEGRVQLELRYYWCTTGDSGACIPERTTLDVQLDTSGTAGGEARLVHTPRAPE